MATTAIGYLRAKNLMVQLDWKAEVTITQEGEFVSFVVYHPKQPNRYNVRRDSAKKLMAECRVVCSKTMRTAIMCYDHDGSDEELI